MVGLAAFGYLLNVAEERARARDRRAGRARRPTTLAVVRAAMPCFAGYMDAVLAGEPVEPIAPRVCCALRQDDGADAMAALRELHRDRDARDRARRVKDDDAADALPQEPCRHSRRWRALPRPAPVPLPPTHRWRRSQRAAPDAAPPHAEPRVRGGARDAGARGARRNLRAGSAGASRDDRAQSPRCSTRRSPEKARSRKLRRAVHTLKGAAGVVGYLGAAKLAHRMEDLLDRLYEGTCDAHASRRCARCRRRPMRCTT